MEIGGFQRFSYIDFPSKIASVVYTQGCNLNCGYCHNKELTKMKKGIYSWESILSKIKEASLLIDGVVFSGGEPTIQKDLISCIEDCYYAGFLIGLHTNGEGDYFEKVIPFVDYILLSHFTKNKIETVWKNMKENCLFQTSIVVDNENIIQPASRP